MCLIGIIDFDYDKKNPKKTIIRNIKEEKYWSKLKIDKVMMFGSPKSIDKIKIKGA